MTFSFIEICAGAGGLSTGLIQAGLTPIFVNDIDKNCCKTLNQNHPNTRVIEGSLEDIDFSIFRGVDVLTGGVPCQSFSQAGSRKGLDDPRGNLLLTFIDIIALITPKVFMIENVKGLLTHDNGNTLKHILNLIQTKTRHEYKIQYKCLDASKYGVPQKRERIFIVGTLTTFSNSLFEFPKEESRRVVLRDVLNDVPESIGAKYSQEKIKLFSLIPSGGCWVDLPEHLQKQYLGKSYNSGGGKRGILRRLSLNEPCLTLLCSPSQKQTERCHPVEIRPLTVREYARIQTFDDNYYFSGSLSSQYKQIGNAVPVKLAKKMGEAIIKYLLNL